jgi:hypothetical protein
MASNNEFAENGFRRNATRPTLQAALPGSPNAFLDHGPRAKLIRQVLGAVAEFDRAMTIAKLRARMSPSIGKAAIRSKAATGREIRRGRTTGQTLAFQIPARRGRRRHTSVQPVWRHVGERRRNIQM